MENCLKRRDHNDSSGLENEESSDLEGDFQECFLSEDRSRSHEQECCLISPYKRLRVEELTHSSIESQSGEGEAHSLLKSSDEADVYSDSYLKTNTFKGFNVPGFPVSRAAGVNQILPSHHRHIGSSGYNQHDTMLVSNKHKPIFSKLASSNNGHAFEAGSSRNEVNHSAQITESEPRLARKGSSAKFTESEPRLARKSSSVEMTESESILKRKDTNSLRRSCDSTNGKTLAHGLNHAITFGRKSDRECSRIPSIDEICMEKEITSADKQLQLTTGLQAEIECMPSSRFQSYNYLHRTSYYPEFHTTHSEHISCQTSDLKHPEMCNQERAHLLLPNDHVTESRGMKFSESNDVLELHSGSIGMSADEYIQPDVQSCQTSSCDKEASAYDDEDDDDHYQTIDDLDVAAVVASSKPSGVADPSSVATFADTREYDIYPKTSEIMKNDLNYYKINQIRSIGISCLSIPCHVRKAMTTTNYHVHSDIVDMSGVHEVANGDTENIGSTSEIKETKSASLNVIKSTAHSGTSTAAHPDSDDVCGNHDVMRARYELSSTNSRCLDPKYELLTHACTPSSWDNAYKQYNEEYHLHQQGLDIQHYPGTYIKSNPSSVQSYSVEELRVHLPGPPNGEHDLGFGGTRDIDSHSGSSRCSSRGDVQYQSLDGYQNQHHISTARNHSAGSGNHHSGSSHASTDHTEKSYPSSLAVSEHSAKKAVLQSSGHLKVAAYWNAGLLTIHVIQARCLSSSWKSHCCSYVKMSLVPDETRRTRCKTRIHQNNNNPIFDEKFSLEVLDEDKRKRLLISVWHKDPCNGFQEVRFAQDMKKQIINNPLSARVLMACLNTMSLFSFHADEHL